MPKIIRPKFSAYYAQTMPIISERSKLVCSNIYFIVYRNSKLKQDGELQDLAKFNVVHQPLRLWIMECRHQQGKGSFLW